MAKMLTIREEKDLLDLERPSCAHPKRGWTSCFGIREKICLLCGFPPEDIDV